MKRQLILVAACLFLFPFSLCADDELQVIPHLHTWGAELDFGWSPFALWPGKDTTLWAGVEGDYKSWNYFHDPVTGNALSSANPSEAVVNEALGLWFLGATQGLVSQASALGPGSRAWEDRSLIEAFAYYRGVYYDTLSAGSYYADSDAPDKDGYLETSFLAGLSLDRITEVDAHDLKEGYLLETSTTLAPRSFQSVAVDYGRVTAIAQGFLPIWDLKPDSRLNTLSLMAAFNLAVDHLWGNSIPSEERQLIGGRAWNGVGGWEEGEGDAVRGVEAGRFDGTDKAVANAELRLNLPGFELCDPFDLPLIDKVLRFVPGIVAYADGGAYGGLAGQEEPGSLFSVGLGAYLTVMKYGTLAIYNDYWLSGGSPYERGSFLCHFELGMHF
jgi:hypothetical protein